MTSPLVLKSLEIYSNIFQRLSNAPLQWNKTQKTIIVTRNPLKLKVYYFNLIVLIIGVGIGSILFLLWKRFFRNDVSVPASIALIHIFCVLDAILCIGLHLIIIIKSKGILIGWNRALEIQKFMRSSKN